MKKSHSEKVNKMRGMQGQILVLVLLIVVVSLAVGLAVATRNLTNIRTSTQAEHSQRAFTAAEGGVESTLSNLNKVAEAIETGNAGTTGCTNVQMKVSATCPLPSSVTGSGVNANVSASNVVVKEIKSYEKTIKLGDVAQVNLANTSSEFNVQWIKSGDLTPASMEFTFICTNDASVSCPLQVDNVQMNITKLANTYGRHSVAFTSGASGTGFSPCVIDTTPGTLFSCKENIKMPGSPKALLLRMKPLWNDVTVRIAPTQADANNFPVQIFEITSTATTDTGLTRKIQVTRDALPVMPAIFDYVLYSGQDINK